MGLDEGRPIAASLRMPPHFRPSRSFGCARDQVLGVIVIVIAAWTWLGACTAPNRRYGPVGEAGAGGGGSTDGAAGAGAEGSGGAGWGGRGGVEAEDVGADPPGDLPPGDREDGVRQPPDLVIDRLPDEPPADLPAERIDNDITNGLVAHWPFDEGAGSTANDLSGNRNTGSVVAIGLEGAWKPGRVGQFSLAIPGSANSAVVIPMSTSLNGIRTGFTIAGWVYRLADLGHDHQTLLSRRLGTTSRELYSLAFHLGTMIGWLYTEPPAENIFLRADRPAPVGVWFHAAMTWDGTTARLYQDGVEVGTLPFSTPLPTSSNAVLLGNNANVSGIDQPLHGWMDDVRLYDRALSRYAIAGLIAAADR